MTYANAQRVLGVMRAQLAVGGLKSEANTRASGYVQEKQHVLWMCDEALSWPPERVDKAMRWLGFVQGWMWSRGFTTVEALQELNRSADTAEA